ncbi:MAG: hypothetical protein ND866_09275 [Pyrinomonadaceae bacterium]|nr:hypothetical protein [Pyrinomonadaceae bacterium]
MKTISLILLIFALTVPGFVGQKQTTQPLKKPKQILFDFRVEQTSAPLRLPAATQKNVLSKVFRKYLTDEGKCNPEFDASSDTDYLKAARNAGQIVPSIVDVVTGSFTVAGRPETAYVISVSECGASHADNFGTSRVAIFAGQQLIADVDVDFKNTIVRKTDLNGDGRDELLMTSGFMNQGILVEMAALLDFQNGRHRVIEDIGTVTEDSCASGIPGSSAKASVVSIVDGVPGEMPRLRIDNYEASCRKAKRWRFLSTGKMPD